MHSDDIARTEVMSLPKDCVWEYKMVDSSRFRPPYDDTLGNELVQLYAEYSGGKAHNGACACLEGISDEKNHRRTIYLSMGQFYDFICCNIIGREMSNGDNRLARYFKTTGASHEALAMTEKLGENFAAERERVRTVGDLTHSSLLPNVIAVSTLVYDLDGNFLLSRRTDSVLIGKRLYGVTSTGTVEPADIRLFDDSGNGDKKMNPFAACSQRELYEETPLIIPMGEFSPRALAAGYSKLQPIAIVDCHYNGLFGDTFRIDDPAGCESVHELAKVVAVPQEKLSNMPSKYDMTEAAAYHIMLHA